MPVLDDSQAWKVNAGSNFFSLAISVAMGVLALLFMNGKDDKGDCKHLHKLFLGVGITELVCALFYLLLVMIFFLTRKDAEKAKTLTQFPTMCLCYGCITLLVFLILGSIWVFDSESAECQNTELHANAKLFMIIWYSLMGASCFIAYCIVPVLVGFAAFPKKGGYQQI